MKTPGSSQGAPVRLAWIACAALALSACTGPGLEPPGSDGDSNTTSGGPKQTRDAGTPHPGDSTDMGATGTGGRSSTGGSTSTGGSGGKAGGNGGTGGENNPPVSTQDAGAPPVDAGDEDAG